MNTMKAEVVVPEWVNWIVVDKDGLVLGCDKEPSPKSHYWGAFGASFTELYKGKPPKNWKDELYTWG